MSDIHEISEAYLANVRPGWIAVADQLPTRVEAQGVAFLWQWNGYAQFAAGSYHHGHFWVDNGDTECQISNDVTHWVALPTVLYAQHDSQRLFVFED